MAAGVDLASLLGNQFVLRLLRFSAFGVPGEAILNVSLVVPLYNEEDAIGPFYRAIKCDPVLQLNDVEIVFIDDGSEDLTGRLAKEIAQADQNVVVLTFSRNFGKEAALFAGIEYATGDAVIPLDADLQDPISVIAQLIEAWQDGAEIVLRVLDDL